MKNIQNRPASQKPRAFLAAWIPGLLAADASALPIVSVVPQAQTVMVGDPFSVEVRAGGVEASQPLQAFEFDLDFPSALLSADSVADGGFIAPPVFVAEQDTAAPDVNFGLAKLGLSMASGSGVLASVSFTALAPGVAALDLNDVVLRSGIGAAQFDIPLDGVNDGSVVIQGPAPGIPEPSVLLLLGAGFLLVRQVTKR